jgi:hypothetical protein
MNEGLGHILLSSEGMGLLVVGVEQDIKSVCVQTEKRRWGRTNLRQLRFSRSK